MKRENVLCAPWRLRQVPFELLLSLESADQFARRRRPQYETAYH